MPERLLHQSLDSGLAPCYNVYDTGNVNMGVRTTGEGRLAPALPPFPEANKSGHRDVSGLTPISPSPLPPTDRPLLHTDSRQSRGPVVARKEVMIAQLTTFKWCFPQARSR